MRCMSGLALLWCVREEGFEVNYQCPSCGYRSTSRWYECAQKKCLLYRPVKKRQKATHAENIPTFFPVVDFQTWQVIFPLGAGGLSLPRVHHCVAYFTTRRWDNHRNCSFHTVEVRHNFISDLNIGVHFMNLYMDLATKKCKATCFCINVWNCSLTMLRLLRN